VNDIVLVVDILAAVGLVALVLLQQGKGADIGAVFGSGASQTLFGSRGSANFLTRTTAVLAIVFFFANMTIAYLSTRQLEPKSVTAPDTTQAPAPSKPATTPAPEVPSGPKPTKVPEVPK